MASYALTCCSTADLTHEQFVARDIQYVCFHFTLNGETYPDDLGQSMPFPIFYQAMANGAETSTSQVNISEYLALFVFVILWICGMVVWLVFVYAVPLSLITLLVLRSVWNGGRGSRYIIAALVLSIIATVYLTFLSRNLWQLFILAIPCLLLVFLCARIPKKR